MMGARKNGHQSTGLKGLSTENTCQARAKAPGPFVVSGSNPTCLPSRGPGTTEQDPDGAGRCWQHCWAPNPLPAVSQLEWLQLEGASGPQSKPAPLGAQLPPVLGAVPRGSSAHFTLQQLAKCHFGQASCLLCACPVPTVCLSCTSHVPITCLPGRTLSFCVCSAAPGS